MNGRMMHLIYVQECGPIPSMQEDISLSIE